MRISVLIRAKNEAQHLPKLAHGLQMQTVKPHQHILVDSGSTDGTDLLASKFGWTLERLDSDKFSFGRALNVGFRRASGDVIVILSAHVYPVRIDFIEQIVAPLRTSSNTVVYGRQVGNDTTKLSEKVMMSQWFPDQPIIDQGHAFANNANSAVPKSLWEKIGYNEELTGFEDVDFAFRAIARGGKVTYADQAPVVHVHNETFKGVANRYQREGFAYKQIFPGEVMSTTKALRLWGRNILRDLQIASRVHAFWRQLLPVLAFRTAQFVGAWRGFRFAGSKESPLLRRIYDPPAAAYSTPQSEVKPALLVNYELMS